jgi:hypothetical protein
MIRALVVASYRSTGDHVQSIPCAVGRGNERAAVVGALNRDLNVDELHACSSAVRVYRGSCTFNSLHRIESLKRAAVMAP